MIGIGTLEEVIGTALRRDHGARRPSHSAQFDIPERNPCALPPLVPEIDAASVCRPVQRGLQGVGGKIAVYTRQDGADERLSASRLSTSTADDVVGERFDDEPVGTPGRSPETRRLARGHSFEHADRPSANASGQLPGADDRGRVGKVALRGRCTERWSAADPPRVKQLPAARAVRAKREDVAPFYEQRPLLLEERLVDSQVHYGRIYLDLSEIRVERGVQCEVGTESVHEIEAPGSRVVRIPAEWIEAGVRVRAALNDVRQ
ncbi:MAG: hypothetical protein MNPFHGCM_01986 [Gemmatimonadaceae bacterium]|nr:hypothetical protein [Gemmatimonadaceae bacterium]